MENLQWSKYDETKNKEWFVSNQGTIKSVSKFTGKETFVKLNRTNSYGYKIVTLRGQGSQKDVTVHKLVVEHFIGPIPEGMVVNHKNGNKFDNDVSNLEIITSKENTQHAVKLGLGVGRPKKKYHKINILFSKSE